MIVFYNERGEILFQILRSLKSDILEQSNFVNYFILHRNAKLK